MPPPTGTWENIARRLDNEFDSYDSKISENIHEAVLEAPPLAWRNIAAVLDEKKEPAKIIPLFARNRMAVAAVVIGVLIIGAWFFRQSIITNNNSVGTASIKQAFPITGNKSDNDEIVKTDELSSSIAQIVPRKVRVKSTLPIEEHIAMLTSGLFETEQLMNYSEPRIISTQNFHVVDATGEAFVTAPLIRDASGKIIMDFSLITTGAGNYFNVTGPNGEQTRISSKFANFLPTLITAATKKKNTSISCFVAILHGKKHLKIGESRFSNRLALPPVVSLFLISWS
jgi:hypothetical protein